MDVEAPTGVALDAAKADEINDLAKAVASTIAERLSSGVKDLQDYMQGEQATIRDAAARLNKSSFASRIRNIKPNPPRSQEDVE